MTGRETFHQSLWSALSPAAAPTPVLTGKVSADVVIVGAGFLGLSLALHLAEAGVRVVLLEADEPGFGASGRNTGFVVPSLKRSLSPADVARHIGEASERLLALVGRSGGIVFDLVDRLGLDCSAERTGWLQPAHDAASLDVLRERQSDWAASGHAVEILDAAETARRVGTGGYHGALFDPTGGQINPLAYARGLAAAAQRLGVALHGGSRVTGLAREGGRWVARTAHGEVTAERAVLTTNALVGALAPEVADSIIPVRVHQVATEPLGAALQRAIVPGRSPVADTRRHTFAVRWSPDGRLMTGGLVLIGPQNLARAKRTFIRRLERFFPDAAPLRPAFVWNGVVATTPDSLPRLLGLAPGLDAVIGCNGRGIALTTALGQELAAHYCGRVGAGELALPTTAPRPLAARRLGSVGPSLWLPWSNLRDRIEAGPR